jgi:hypothetical protein
MKDASQKMLHKSTHSHKNNRKILSSLLSNLQKDSLLSVQIYRTASHEILLRSGLEKAFLCKVVA